jgi:very-short-patch-repair endonuclease
MKMICQKCACEFQPRGTRCYFCDMCRIRKCDWCKGFFFDLLPLKEGPRTCSLECRSKLRFDGSRVTLFCNYCGKKLITSPGVSARKRYCSRTCRSKGSWKNPLIREKLIVAIKASPTLHSPERMKQLARIRKLRKPVDDAHRENARAKRLTQKFPTKMTTIELVISNWLIEEGIKFEMHENVLGRWQPDFTIRSHSLLIQADGDYWHSLPGAEEKDHIFNTAARAIGWRVLRLKEKDIKKFPLECRKKIHLAMFLDRLDF